MSLKKLGIALDFTDIEDAEQFLYSIEDKDIVIKIGYSLFIKYGKDITDFVKSKGFELFLDLKLHDIPNTVYNGVKGAIYSGADYLTIHTLGGKEMLQKAVEAKGSSSLKLLGVTILTSHDERYLDYIGCSKYSIKDLTLNLAKTALETGIDGIVSSVDEVSFLKENIEKEFIAVTPGIRLEDDSKDDQKRVATPKKAVEKGANILIVGRPIIKAKNPNEKIKKIKESMNI
ncbi:orotidine-5'-phosphate decarboxylase [Hydrogenivirga sp. 128-5-R1-1]|uniref:orotidine-5'-phosphate decarboxylase n=1 Tax=Hydrogenivirga sp. 128-5-R1-1 TaxID=392423 RepID=UPI00015F1A07|nr:orotidine-5'-phosphate decarboxylase [Hydrogenivirga sp. 128-5-R1-1]EDP74042.1 orotidine-5'-phosphate decarboxylase [Hydrogenivirga sp. 128-5-R1-1]